MSCSYHQGTLAHKFPQCGSNASQYTALKHASVGLHYSLINSESETCTQCITFATCINGSGRFTIVPSDDFRMNEPVLTLYDKYWLTKLCTISITECQLYTSISFIVSLKSTLEQNFAAVSCLISAFHVTIVCVTIC